MKKYRIVCICQIYNELEKGNLPRFFKYIKPLVDVIVIYDDGSTDGSYEYALLKTPYVIRGGKNDFSDEIRHRQTMLEKAIELKTDFILWLDADEILTNNAKEELPKICQTMIEKKIDGINLHELNIWRSATWRRMDSLFDNGWFTRIWRVKDELSFTLGKKGLHQSLVPPQIKIISNSNKLNVFHYGFSNEKNLAYKYLIYKSHGQRGYNLLDRLINEDQLTLEKIPENLFPNELFIQNEPKPEKMSFAESLSYVKNYKNEVFRPKYSIVCLIYKSVDWLKFVYQQVLKYTDLTDKEFYFVANDANKAVLDYLKDNYIPHYIFNNSEEQRKEWYINNVYRAWNYAAKVAKGDFIVFINSDMAFAPNWFDNLVRAYNGGNCLVSRLVESGKLKSGSYGIEKNFGTSYLFYKEEDFQQYAASIPENVLKNGGLYMPLLIRKEHFLKVGGYPEGNVKPGTNIFHPEISQKGEQLISGDLILMEKLKSIGIRHQTVFNSIVYHFQCGEMNENKPNSTNKEKIEIAVCNDLIRGTMGEKVFWGFLIENLPGAYGIDKNLISKKNFEEGARKYIDKYHPQTKIIIQNASFINTIDSHRCTIAFLQDDLRSMNRKSLQQETNLRIADKIVANSIQTSLSYSEYDCEIIPVGIDSELFQPMDKSRMRQKHGFGKEKTGIFVGNFSEVKGWSRVVKCIKNHPEITWILVSKCQENFLAKNVRVFNKINQNLLVELLNCADFFIIGSPVETQCLAAVEACFCNIPLVMPLVGIFKDFSNEERSNIGIFADDLEKGIKKIFNQKFQSRNIILKKKLTVLDSMEKWQILMEKIIISQNISRYQKESKNLHINVKKTYFKYKLELFFRKKILQPIFKKEFFNAKQYFRASYFKLIIVTILKKLGLLKIVKKLLGKTDA